MLIEFKKEVNFCSLCPHGFTDGPYWNPDFEEEDYKVYCMILDKVVHEDLHWTECAAKTSKRTGLDVPGDFCPFSENNKQQ